MKYQQLTHAYNLPIDMPQLTPKVFGKELISTNPEEYAEDITEKFHGNHNKFVGIRLRLIDGRSVDALLKMMGGNYGLPFDEYHTWQAFKAAVPKNFPIDVPAMAPSRSNRYVLMEEVKGRDFSSLVEYEEKKLAAYILGMLARMNGIITHTKQEHLKFSDATGRMIRLDLEWGLKPDISMEEGIGMFELSALESLVDRYNPAHSNVVVFSGLGESYTVRNTGNFFNQIEALASNFRDGFYDMDNSLKQNVDSVMRRVEAAAKDKRTKVNGAHVKEIGRRVTDNPEDILIRLTLWRKQNSSGHYLDHMVSDVLRKGFF